MAAGTFDGIDDQAGRGRALVDRGQFLYYLGRPQEAAAAAGRALELLPDSLPAYRFSAYVGRCLCCLALGEHSQAQDLAREAERLPVGPRDRGKLSWLRATTCRKLGNRAGALEHFRRGAETLRTVHLGEHLLISLELVETLLDHRRPDEALQVCSTLHDLLTPLRHNPIISGALMELLRASATGRADKLSLDLVRRVRAKIERERERKDARARKAWRTLAVGSTRPESATVP